MELCALADLKTWLDISLSDTSKDAKLTLFIDNVSAQIEQYLGYPLEHTVYAGDTYSVNNMQMLYLRQKPIQSITSVSLDGRLLVAGQEDGYMLSPEDAQAGRIYRGIGWIGRWYTREMTYDPVAGTRTVVVSWTGGWYLPDDTDYDKGDLASLPYGITAACINEIVPIYRRNFLRGEGMTGYSEGGINFRYYVRGNENGNTDSAGLSITTQGMLNPYRRWGIA
jgi:hypothetical protein